MIIQAVVFDLDGVLVDTEEVWDSVRYEFATAHGGRWRPQGDQAAVMGANSMQWAASMRENNGVDLPDQAIYEGIVGRLRERYACHLPLMPGAAEAVAGLASAYHLGVASSSPLEIIEYVLGLADLRRYFSAVVSSDEVAVGKPAPDVYLEACARLKTRPERAAAVEDSASGIQAAHSAGLAVIAIPNRKFPPAPDVLALTDVVLDSIGRLDREVVASLGGRARGPLARGSGDGPSAGRP